MIKNKRIEYLDSIRGIAALFVVISHCLLTFPAFFNASNSSSEIVKLVTFTPLHFFWSGRESVLLFFILSGFVLSIPFLNNRPYSFSGFLIKRFCRIYIPYIFAMVLSIVLFMLLSVGQVSYLSDWFNLMWEHPVTFQSIVSYLLMLGSDVDNINTVTWSLVHEMRISIFFPFLAFFCIRNDWKKVLVTSLVACLSMWVFINFAKSFIHNKQLAFMLFSIGETFYYTPFFIIGLLLAKHKSHMVSYVLKLNRAVKYIILFAAFLLYTLEYIFTSLSKVSTLLSDYSIACGSSLFFMLILSSSKGQSVLNLRPFIFLGKISYSLYLIHPIVILLLVHTTTESIPTPVVVFLVPIVSILMAWGMYYAIEKPSILLGKKIKIGQKDNGNLVNVTT